MKRLLGLIAALAMLQLSTPTRADPPGYATAVSVCGTPGNTPIAGGFYPITQDLTGKLCTAAAFSGSITANQGTPGATPWPTTETPGTTGGLSSFVLEPAASDNHTNIKNGAGQVYGIQVFNNSATVNYVRLYNAATGFNGCNSATNLLWEGNIPASTSGAGFVAPIPDGLAFSTGISICVTGAYGQTNTTSATASAISLNVLYK